MTTPSATAPRPAAARFALPVSLAVLAVAALIAIGFVRYFSYARAHETTDDATVDADAVAVTSKIGERVARVLVDRNELVHRGQLLVLLDDRDERTRLTEADASRRALFAQARALDARVDLSRDTQAAEATQNAGALAQQQAAIAKSESNLRAQAEALAAAGADVDECKAQLLAARASVPAERARLRSASSDLARARALARTGDMSQSEFDAAQAQFAAAQSAEVQAENAVTSASAKLTAARGQLGEQRFNAESSSEAIAEENGRLVTARGREAESAQPSRIAADAAGALAAHAQIATADARYDEAANQLAYTRIVAPIDGYVGVKNVEPGATVATGQTLLTIVPLRNIYVTANFKETQLGRMHPGERAEITVDAYDRVTFTGHIASISPASQDSYSVVPAQNVSGTFIKVAQRVPVRIAFDSPDPRYRLRPGMSVEASVDVAP